MLWRMMDQEAFFCIFAFARCVYKEHPMPKSRAKKTLTCVTLIYQPQ